MFTFILPADPAAISLGRFDSDSLTDQIKMELLIGTDSEYHTHFLDESGDFQPVCSWYGVTCDKKGTVIAWNLCAVGSAHINLEFIPSNVLEFGIERSRAEGTLDATALPRALQKIELRENLFDGGVDMTGLPPNLIIFDIHWNDFTGNADVLGLPASLEVFRISRNKFTGSLFLDALPANLKTFDANSNSFRGSIDVAHLPRSMQTLDLGYNELCWCLILKNFPPALKVMNLSWNGFGREVRVVDIPPSTTIINLSNNMLCGTAVVDRAMHSVVDLSQNQLETLVDEKGRPFECEFDEMRYLVRYSENSDALHCSERAQERESIKAFRCRHFIKFKY